MTQHSSGCWVFISTQILVTQTWTQWIKGELGGGKQLRLASHSAVTLQMRGPNHAVPCGNIPPKNGKLVRQFWCEASAMAHQRIGHGPMVPMVPWPILSSRPPQRSSTALGMAADLAFTTPSHKWPCPGKGSPDNLIAYVYIYIYIYELYIYTHVILYYNNTITHILPLLDILPLVHISLFDTIYIYVVILYYIIKSLLDLYKRKLWYILRHNPIFNTRKWLQLWWMQGV